MSEFAERLKELREKAGLNNAQFAYHAEWNPSRLSNYESGKRTPALTDLREAADALMPFIGDQYFYLVTGRHPEEYLNSSDFDNASRFISKEQAIKAFGDTILAALDANVMKLKPGTSANELLELFVSKFDKSVGAAQVRKALSA